MIRKGWCGGTENHSATAAPALPIGSYPSAQNGTGRYEGIEQQ